MALGRLASGIRAVILVQPGNSVFHILASQDFVENLGVQVALDHFNAVHSQIGGQRRQRQMRHTRRPVRGEKQHDFHIIIQNNYTSAKIHSGAHQP